MVAILSSNKGKFQKTYEIRYRMNVTTDDDGNKFENTACTELMPENYEVAS